MKSIALFVYLEQDTSSLMQFLCCFALTAKMYLTRLTQGGVDEKFIILIKSFDKVEQDLK